ncbi:DUF7507 domain-containing protein, partial [Nioella ostreopsis]|uniref:DUF7507 domain-containing protein n=1 Tax=Nioella ostreopsis TaxID=2448479 RepID=UPI000FD8399C
LSDDTLTRLDAGSTELTLGSGPTAGSWPGTTGELAPGESVTYTAGYTLTQADIDAGGVANSATASASAPNGDPVTGTSDSDADTAGNQPTETTISASPELTVTKSVSSTDLTVAGGAEDTVWNPGDTITYAVAIENTGNVALDTVALTDALASGSPVTLTASDVTVTGEVTADDILEPGETWTYSYDYAVTQADIDAGQVLNTASVTAQDPTDTDVTGTSDGDGDPAQDSDEDSDPTNDPLVQTLAASPELTVVKTETSGNTAAGDALSWSIVVTNAGNVTLSSVTLSDDTLTRLDEGSTELTLGSGPTAGSWPGTTGELAPGESVTYTAGYTLTQADIDAGGVANSATASASAPNGDPVTGTSDSDADTAGNQPTETTISASPELTIDHVLVGVSREFNTQYRATFRTTVSNDGNVTLTEVSLTNDLAAFVGSGNLVEVISVSRVSGATSLGLSSDYDGQTTTEMLVADSTLSAGQDAIFDVTFRFLTPDGFPTSDNVATAGADELDSPVEDSDGLGITDADGDGGVDSQESDTADRDEDGIVDSEDYDPTGYFYCEEDGRILSGGSISVVDASGSSDNVVIDFDGTDGYYQWYATAAGVYTMSVSYPTSVGVASTTRLVSTSALDVTSLLPADPAFLGSTEVGDSGELADESLAANPVFYRVFTIEAGDPNVMANNIPMEQCADNSVSVSAHQNGGENNEGTPTDGSFTVSMPRATIAAVELSYTIGGTAVADTDYTALSGSVTIAQGDTSVTVNVPVLEDALIEADETVTLTLTGITGGDGTTQIATDGTQSRSLSISSDDNAGLRIVDVDLDASESGDTGTMRFSLTAVPESQVTLTFAGDGQCTISPSSMVFGPGDWDQTQDLSITPIADDVVEGLHTCRPTVAVSSSDMNYDGLAPVLSDVSIVDGLLSTIRDQLIDEIEDEIEATIRDQVGDMRGFASGAGTRLRQEALDSGYCSGPDRIDPEGSLSYSGGRLSFDATISDDYFDCVAEERVIVEAETRYRWSDDSSGMLRFSGSYLREHRDEGERIRGRFLTGYITMPVATDDDVAGMRGVGLAFGIYGATRLENDL